MPKTTKPDPIHRRVFTKAIRVGLDPAEREPLTKQLTSMLRTETELRIEAQNVAAGYRKKLKDCKKEIDNLCVTLEQGHPEDHEVEEVKDFRKGTVTTIRTDTRAVIEKRDMTEEDRQLDLGGAPDPDKDDDQDDNE